MNIELLSKLAIGQALAGSTVVQSWIAEAVENETLMLEARAITGKSAAEILDAAACTSLCFRDFVQQLKAGLRI